MNDLSNFPLSHETASADSGSGIFINGKSQIIEMLQMMDAKEKEKLIRNMAIRNPNLAQELSIKSISFLHLGNLSDHELRMVLNYCQAPIVGLALKEATQELQRRILTLMDRSQAEIAYEVMMAHRPNAMRDCKRSQEKVLEVAGQLHKKRLIKLY